MFLQKYKELLGSYIMIFDGLFLGNRFKKKERVDV